MTLRLRASRSGHGSWRASRVDAHGIAWSKLHRWSWAGEFAGTFYSVTFNERVRDGWAVRFSDGFAPFRDLDRAAAEAVVSALVAWLQASGAEVPR